MNSWSQYPIWETLKFKDQCFIPQLKVSLQGMTTPGYRIKPFPRSAWSRDSQHYSSDCRARFLILKCVGLSENKGKKTAGVSGDGLDPKPSAVCNDDGSESREPEIF